MEIIYRELASLVPNPKNPRKQSPKGVRDLAVSIENNPRFFEARPILLSDRTGKLVIIAGERRSEAAKLLGMKEVPTILLSGLSEAEEDEIMIRDNTHAGIWDYEKLKMWGKEDLKGWDVEIKEEKMTSILSELEYKSMYYEPVKKPNLSLIDCLNFDKYDAKIAAIEAMNLSKKKKEVLKFFAYRFIKIDFESVANYYYFNASAEEKKAIERLRLVLIDGGGRRIHRR